MKPFNTDAPKWPTNENSSENIGYICVGIKVIRSDSNSSGWVSNNRFLFFFLWQSAEDQSTAVTGWGKKPLCRNSILLSIPSLESISLIFSINTSAENIIWFISQLVFQISTKFTTVLAVNLLLKSVTKKEIPNLCRPGPSGFTAFFLFFTQ